MAWLDSRGTNRTSIDETMQAAVRHLGERDTVVAELIRRFGPYEFRSTRSGFQVLLETVVSQQLSTSAARAIYGRLAAAMGPGAPRPESLLRLPSEQLLACGLSRSKTVYVRNVADAFRSGDLNSRTLTRLDDAAVIAALTSVKGIGEWSAHMYLIFALRRLDVFPIGDLGLRKAMASQYKLRKNSHVSRYHKIAEAWSPYRTVGTLYLWKSYDNV
ncbi:MAG TPA: DNA-3-methyladenine glycosylase 2 family protein [Candidatus Krumholzibacteria bacterium]|nr:DNA-3-methyladenine glycosylase 2 family protein [Candidatus Krumholzibacteria bacterium]